jgi:hypothetical protein
MNFYERLDMNCPNCDGELQPAWKVCPNCGIRLEKASVAPPAGSVVAVGPVGITKARMGVGGDAVATGAAPSGGTPASGMPFFTVGSESVVKATVDASSHNTRRYAGDSVQGDKIVQNITHTESAIAAIFRLASGNQKLDELTRQLEQIDWGKDPVELKRVFRKHISVIEEESFGDTIRTIMRGYFALATWGLLGTSKESKERKLRLRICKMVIESLDDLSAGRPEVAPILTDCRTRYADAIRVSQRRLWIVVGVPAGVYVILTIIILATTRH